MMTDPAQSGFTADGLGNYISEMPGEGNTEIWEIVNMTADAHPIHLHLAGFQLMNRQAFFGDIDEQTGYYSAHSSAFSDGVFKPGFGPPLPYAPSSASGGKYGGNPDISSFLLDAPVPPDPNEVGWKDTILVPPGMVTRLVVRWAPTDIKVTPGNSGELHYAFLPNDAVPGHSSAHFDYVWHCHIVDHEDNEMMRPDMIVPEATAARTYVMGQDY